MDAWCPILFSGLSSATIFYLMLKLSLNLARGNPFKLAWSSSHVPIILRALPCCLVWQNVPGSCPTFPAPAPDWVISTRSPSSWKLNRLRTSQDLSAKQAYGYWGVRFQAHWHTHTYILIYNHTYFYFPLCKLQARSSHRYLSFQPNTTGFILASSLSLPLSLCETWLPSSLYIYLFDQSPYKTNLSSPLPLYPLQGCAPLLTLASTCPGSQWPPDPCTHPPCSAPLHGSRTQLFRKKGLIDF